MALLGRNYLLIYMYIVKLLCVCIHVDSDWQGSTCIMVTFFLYVYFLSFILLLLLLLYRYYWYVNTLEANGSINDFSGFNWKIYLCLFAGWVIVYLCMFKGIQSTGKVHIHMCVYVNLKYVVNTCTCKYVCYGSFLLFN